MSKAEREVATATVSQGRVICPKCGSSDSTLPHTTGNGIAYNCSRCWLVFTPPSLPEAVAGNASAPVGEPSATVVSANESAVIPLDKLSEEWDRLDRYYSQLADVAAGAGYDKGSFIGKSIGFSVCAAQLRAALPASSGMGSGQPSGVGEPPIKKFQVLMDRMVGVYRVAVEPVPSPLQPLQAIAQEQANQAWFIEQAISEKLEREK